MCVSPRIQKQHGYLVLLSCATLLGVALAAGVTPTLASTPSGDVLLRDMIKAERTIQYSGVARMARQGGPTIVVSIWRNGVRRRLDYSAPQIMRGDVLVDDGSNVWRYHRADNTAVQTRSAVRTGASGMNLERIDRTFSVKVLGKATTAGRPAWLVTLAPRNGGQAGRKLWIDQQTKALLRVEQIGRAGGAGDSLVLQRVNFGPVPAAKFHWSPPPQAKVTRTSGMLFMQLAQARQAARSWLQLPHYIPRGYVFESAVVDSTKGEAWLRYTNGLIRFSIFQQRAPDGDSRPLRKVSGAWYWQRGGSRFLLVGPPVDQAGNIAASVR